MPQTSSQASHSRTLRKRIRQAAERLPKQGVRSSTNTSQGMPRASQISLKRTPNAPECVGSFATSPAFGSEPYWRKIFGARPGEIFRARAAGEKRATGHRQGKSHDFHGQNFPHHILILRISEQNYEFNVIFTVSGLRTSGAR